MHCTNPASPCDGGGDIAAYINARGDIEAWFYIAFFALPPRVGFDTQADSGEAPGPLPWRTGV
ncbi:hypothetical protein [Pseudomonas saponiphila]|uniref:hypothetical protein n=1 Tax=Pseudomonas saponiphila TaxID=556534 RepID=UPI00223F8C93|nr:hypothetical protein [Pseudomonas saponiphila]